MAGGVLTSIPEQGETHTGTEEQEEAGGAQAQPRAGVDLGGRHTHPIHRHCPACGGAEAFRPGLGVQGPQEPHEALPASLPSSLSFLPPAV